MSDDILGGEFSSSFGGNAGNLEIDLDRAASAFPELDDGSDFATAPHSTIAGPGTSTNNFAFDDFDVEPPVQQIRDVKVTGDDEIEKFENEFPDIEIPQEPPAFSPPSQPAFNATPTFAPQPQQSAFHATPILNQPLEEEEPEAIKQWREKQAEEIRARDETSKAKRQETIGHAERAIDEFYENYAKKKERAIRENKESEAEYLQKIQDSLTAGTTWERIAELVELQNSQSKTLARTGAGTTDLTRFKEVLLRLKREGASAPGAAGY